MRASPPAMIPRLYLGTMTFGWSQSSSKVDDTVALEMMQSFLRHDNGNTNDSSHHHHIDTARIYAGGKTEEMLGRILHQGVLSNPNKIVLGTKAHPSQPNGLSAKGIQSQLQMSLECMQLALDHNDSDYYCMGEYYLHQPDTEHSLLESLTCLHELKVNGSIDTIGMSNYHCSEMERAFALCDEYQLTKPEVYQGLYNPLNRAVETDLIPLLHRHDCSFVAYNPLAAGLLVDGKHDLSAKVKKGRFRDNPNYLPRFYTEPNFEAIRIIQQACEKEDEGWTMLEATFQWLLGGSSALRPEKDDGVLLGASSVDQLVQNLKACEYKKRKLPENIVQAFDEAWAITKDHAFPYWRGYSSDMPNRENLDQGANYQAKK